MPKPQERTPADPRVITISQIGPTGDAIAVHSFRGQEAVFIGRAADCDVSIADPRCSRKHCQLAYDDDPPGWILHDMESDNGVRVNGQLIAGPHRLREGDRFSLSDDVQFLHVVGGEPPREVKELANPLSSFQYTWVDHRGPAMVESRETLAADEGGGMQLRRARLESCPITEIARLAAALNDATLIDDPLLAREQLEQHIESEIGRCLQAMLPGDSVRRVVVWKAGGRPVANDLIREALRTELTVSVERDGHTVICSPFPRPATADGEERPAPALDRAVILAEGPDLGHHESDILALVTALTGTAYYACQKRLDELRDASSECSLLGVSPQMRALEARLRTIADVESTVLILGESGVGKEVIAQLLHDTSPRRNKAYLRINCGAIAGNVIESELFGHVAGAFTGASSERKGLFQAAHGGTLLLDEIGDMPLDAQVKLLRVLEQGVIVRVGEAKEIDVDVRVIAATHRDLERRVRKGLFREDLFYRLNVVPLAVPPLREHLDDVRPLVDTFLKRFNANYKRRVGAPNDEALHALRAHGWPGNVRELKNVVENIVVYRGAMAGPITAEEVQRALETIGALKQRDRQRPSAPLVLDDFDKSQVVHDLIFIRTMLKRCQNDIGEVAKKLGRNEEALRRLISRRLEKYPQLREEYADVRNAFKQGR
jgi:DNA-binding NtrC family response regulator